MPIVSFSVRDQTRKHCVRGKAILCSEQGPWAATLERCSPRCGLGSLKLVDPDVLLPGNVVRHVAGHGQVGTAKVKAVQAVIADHAPWTEVACFQEGPGTPSAIRERIADTDIIIDATGNEALLGSLALVAAEMGKPLVSGALYRGGFIGRVQRQVLPTDTPIHLREDSTRYPVIPAGTRKRGLRFSSVGLLGPRQQRPSLRSYCLPPP